MGRSSVKEPLANELIFYHITGWNLVDQRGFSASVTPIGYGLYTLSGFGYIYFAFVSVFIFAINHIAKKIIKARNYALILLAMNFLMTDIFSRGMVLFELSAILAKTAQQFFLILVVIMLYKCYRHFRDILVRPVLPRRQNVKVAADSYFSTQ